MEIKSIESIETNPAADIRFCNNGGGYFQPETTVTFDNGSTVDIVDTSCGDFGSRIYATYYSASGAEIGNCVYGSMLRDEELYSNLRYSEQKEMFDLVEQKTGYRLLTVEEWEEIIDDD